MFILSVVVEVANVNTVVELLPVNCSLVTVTPATQDGSNVDLNLDATSGTDSTVQFTAGTGITLTRTSAQEITIESAEGVTVTKKRLSSRS